MCLVDNLVLEDKLCRTGFIDSDKARKPVPTAV